jgi:hypothetical protein
MPLKRRKNVVAVRATASATIDSNEKASSSPSGRGVSGGGALSARIDNPNRLTGKVPLKNTSGSPSSSPDVNASRMMQNVMGDDDKEWYEKLFKKMHKDFLKPRNTVKHGFDVGLSCGYEKDYGELFVETLQETTCLRCSMNMCKTHVNECGAKKQNDSVQRDNKDKLILEPDASIKAKKKKKKKLKRKDEFSAASAVAGYTLPLGKSNLTDKQQKDRLSVSARMFGGGDYI